MTADSRYRILDFRGVTVATPNESEAEAAVGIRIRDTASLEAAGRKLLETLGHEGAADHARQPGDGALRARQGRALDIAAAGSEEVTDVSGAGDTVIAVVTLALAAGASFEEAARLSNAAAGVVVMKAGAATCSPAELLAAAAEADVTAASQDRRPVAPSSRAASRRSASRGGRIVLSNGAFDLVHVGHVRSLEHARTLGDFLVVAVNSDRSVRELKGAGPPGHSRARARRDRRRARVRRPRDDLRRADGRGDDPAHQAGRPRQGARLHGGVRPRTRAGRSVGGKVVIVGDPKDHATSDLIARIRTGGPLDRRAAQRLHEAPELGRGPRDGDAGAPRRAAALAAGAARRGAPPLRPAGARGPPDRRRALGARPAGREDRVRPARRTRGGCATRSFDLAIFFTNSLTSVLGPALARIPRRVGYEGDWRSPLLTDRAPRKDRRAPDSDAALLPRPRPVLSACRRRATHYDVPVRDRGPRRRRRASSRGSGSAAERPLAALNPGAKFGSSKLWALDRFAEIGDRLVRERGFEVDDPVRARRGRDRAGDRGEDAARRSRRRTAGSCRCTLLRGRRRAPLAAGDDRHRPASHRRRPRRPDRRRRWDRPIRPGRPGASSGPASSATTSRAAPATSGAARSTTPAWTS